MLQPESGRTLIARLAAELSSSAPTTKLTAGLMGKKSQGAENPEGYMKGENSRDRKRQALNVKQSNRYDLYLQCY